MTSHLIQWKNESIEQLKTTAGFARMNASEVEDMEFFIEALVDRIHSHTLEEVRGIVKEVRISNEPENFNAALSVQGHTQALDELLAALELLEHPTD